MSVRIHEQGRQVRAPSGLYAMAFFDFTDCKDLTSDI